MKYACSALDFQANLTKSVVAKCLTSIPIKIKFYRTIVDLDKAIFQTKVIFSITYTFCDQPDVSNIYNYLDIGGSLPWYSRLLGMHFVFDSFNGNA